MQPFVPMIAIGQGIKAFSSKASRIPLENITCDVIHLIDTTGIMKENQPSAQVLASYDSSKYELLKVSEKDSVPVIKVFPKSNPLKPEKIKKEFGLIPIIKVPKEKTIEMNSTIGGNDFEHKVHTLLSFLAKRHTVRVYLTLRSSSTLFDLEALYGKIQTRINESSLGRIMQPVQQSADKIKFTIQPSSTKS